MAVETPREIGAFFLRVRRGYGEELFVSPNGCDESEPLKREVGYGRSRVPKHLAENWPEKVSGCTENRSGYGGAVNPKRNRFQESCHTNCTADTPSILRRRVRKWRGVEGWTAAVSFSSENCQTGLA
jgi:hypothetical protein